jgi:hypothetical protein
MSTFIHFEIAFEFTDHGPDHRLTNVRDDWYDHERSAQYTQRQWPTLHPLASQRNDQKNAGIDGNPNHHRFFQALHYRLPHRCHATGAHVRRFEVKDMGASSQLSSVLRLRHALVFLVLILLDRSN